MGGERNAYSSTGEWFYPLNRTLDIRMWAVYEQGYLGYAAVSALILLFVSGLSMLVILSQEGYNVK